MAEANVDINEGSDVDTNSVSSEDVIDYESSDDCDSVIDFANMAYKYDHLFSSGLKYSGGPNDDLDSFITRFKDYAELKNYTGAKTVLALNSLIEGHARTFLSTIPQEQKDTVAKIEKLLKDQFEGQSWLWGVETQLLSRKQNSTETLDDYSSDIMLWGRQTKKTDAELKSIFMRGLLPSTRAFVFSQQPETFQDALNAARLGISVQRTSEEQSSSCTSHHEKTVQPHVTHVSATPPTSSLENLCSLVQNISTRLESVENNLSRPIRRPENHVGPNFRPNRTVVCYRCGYTGHKWRNCFAKKGIDGKLLN